MYTVERTRQSCLAVCNMLNLLHHTHFGQADDDSSAGNAHPLWQQGDLLSALPTSPIRIEEILALRSGLPTNETGVLAAGSGCGNAHIPALPPSRPPKPPVTGVVVCDPAVFFLSAISLTRHSSSPRGQLSRMPKTSTFSTRPTTSWGYCVRWTL